MRFKNGSIDKTVTGIVTGTVNGEKAQNLVQIFFFLFPPQNKRLKLQGSMANPVTSEALVKTHCSKGKQTEKKILRKEVDSMT